MSLIMAAVLAVIAFDSIKGWFEGPPRTLVSVRLLQDRVTPGASMLSEVEMVKHRECPTNIEHQIIYPGETVPVVAREGVSGIGPLGRISATVPIPIRVDAKPGPAIYQIRWEFFCPRGASTITSRPISFEIVPLSSETRT